MYTVGIIDDHPVFRMGLKTLINRNPKMKVIFSLETAQAFYQISSKQYPDLWIIDWSLKETSGLHLLTYALAQKPQQNVLVLSMHEESLYGERALRAGAIGYLNKSLPPEELIPLLERACTGYLCISDEFKDFLVHNQIQINSPISTETDPILANLSNRELEVFIKLGQGKKAAHIAEDLKVSIKTIDSHLHNIKKKCGASNMVGLICKAAVWVHDYHHSTSKEV